MDLSLDYPHGAPKVIVMSPEIGDLSGDLRKIWTAADDLNTMVDKVCAILDERLQKVVVEFVL